MGKSTERYIKRWVPIALLLLLVGWVLVWRLRPVTQSSHPQTEVTVPAHRPLELFAPTHVPLVDQQRLVTHLQALIGERHSQAGRDRARSYLVNTLRQYGWTVTRQPFPGGVNVVARPAAKKPDADTVLVVAHYDTVEGSPGADDNATGVVAALEVAHLLRTRSSDPSLAIALFDREEQGLVGSLAFTANPANLNHLVGVINLEMLGYTCNTPGCQVYPEGLPISPPSDRGDFLGVVGDLEHEDLLQAFQLAHSSTLPPLITLPVPFKGILTPDVLRSDHASFWAKNIGAVMVGDTANFRNPHYHQPSDTLDTLDIPFLTRATQLVVNATTVLLDGKH